ncbi:hypothetical protein ACJZ2D_003681 [Fusarium nematophilum]
MAYNRPYDEDALPRCVAPPHSPRGVAALRCTPKGLGNRRHDATNANSVVSYRFAEPEPYGYGHMSPPPNPGGARPQPHNRPAANSRPPPSPAIDGSGSDPTLLPLFRAVDKDGTGHLSERELSAALVNGDWTAFDPHTVRMMIRMFDSDRSGTIGFEEFCGLWSFLASWRTLFDRFDADRSGNISLPEFNNALVAFRYRLSPQLPSERNVELWGGDDVHDELRGLMDEMGVKRWNGKMDDTLGRGYGS